MWTSVLSCIEFVLTPHWRKSVLETTRRIWNPEILQPDAPCSSIKTNGFSRRLQNYENFPIFLFKSAPSATIKIYKTCFVFCFRTCKSNHRIQKFVQNDAWTRISTRSFLSSSFSYLTTYSHQRWFRFKKKLPHLSCTWLERDGYKQLLKSQTILSKKIKLGPPQEWWTASLHTLLQRVENRTTSKKAASSNRSTQLQTIKLNSSAVERWVISLRRKALCIISFL